jgi:glycosyltransferase involved in cell wall biosynthesis
VLPSFDDIRALQTSIGLHLCPSEREGFGHYLNEARAAAAFIISTDHPPMNEFVTKGFGVLIKPKRVESYTEWQSLGELADINAFLVPEDICAAVETVLSTPVEQRAAMGRAAWKQYLAEKSQFVRKMRRLRTYLAQWRQHGLEQRPG